MARTFFSRISSEKKPNNLSDYEFYIKILEQHNVLNTRENVANMFIVDYLMMNTDRHLKNFGIIRNVNTLEWVRTTPIFDTGQSMQCDKYLNEMDFSYGTGKFFTNTAKDYEDILKTIGSYITTLDIKKLNGLCDEYKTMLEQYQDKQDISDKRIEKLTSGLKERIEKLEANIEMLKLNK